MNTKISHITIYDGKDAKECDSAIVFSETGIIALSKEAESISADREINGTGCSALPGYINMHVHLSMDATPEGFVSNDTYGLAAYRSFVNARKQLEGGVVLARNLGSRFGEDIDLKAAIEQNLVAGPRLFASGPFLTMTGGHGHTFGIEVDGEQEVRKAARSLIKRRANVLKVMATGGGLTPGVKPGAAQFSEQEMAVVCGEARKVGIITAAHAQGNEGIKNAIRAGITTIEHGVELDDEAIDLMLSNNVALVATLAAPRFVVKHGIQGGIPAEAVEKNKAALDVHRESFQKAFKAGVTILAGNDAGTPFNRHEDFATELRLMAETCMSVRAVIRAASSSCARVLGLQKETGALEKGKQADIVLVKGDPEADLQAFGNIRGVFIKGTLMFES